jgi:AmmeMemoRadiSam system protein A/AmmeMemoRadiSam system protein B
MKVYVNVGRRFDMGSITGAFIFPHPPIMIEEVGKRETKKVEASIAAAEEAAKRIGELKPDTIVIISPHGTLFRDAMSFAAEERLEGSLVKFGAPQVKIAYDNDIELLDKIMEKAEEKRVYCIPVHEDVKKSYGMDTGLDHGATVPLYFINKKYSNFKLVHITYSLLSREHHYKLGMSIRDAVSELDRKVVVIASSDLSHRLTKDAPAGFNSRGLEFDKEYVELIKNGDIEGFLSLSPDLIEDAGQCGYNSTIILLGCFDGYRLRGDVLSYEGPFGVGYCIAQLFPEGKSGKTIEKSSDPYVKLAIKTLETYVRTGRKPEIPEGLPAEMMDERAGVFVSLKKHGELRGCIGTIGPTTKNIAEEIMQNAISAGTRDPRFFPVEEEELEELEYSVDVLMEPEPIQSKDELDVKRYGVIVRSGMRSGLLLPNLEGVDTVEEQVGIALRKAGIASSEKYSMERFEVIRHY